MDARLTLAFATLSAAALAAAPLDGGGGGVAPAGFKASLVDPRPGADGQLRLVVGATINGVVRVEGLDKETTSDVVFFRFMRGSAMAGEFIGKQKRVDDHVVEYGARLKAPPFPGNYTLEVVPVSSTPSQKTPPGRDKYPTLKVVVTR